MATSSRRLTPPTSKDSSVFLPKNRKSLYVRLVIPEALRHHYFNGRAEVWRSLHTLDKELAQVSTDQWEAAGRALFLKLRRYGERMTKGQIDELVNNWLESALDEAEDLRLLNGPFTDSYRETAALVLHDQLEQAAGDELSYDFSRIEKEADALLKSAGLPPLDHDSAEFGRLCRRLLQGKQEFLHAEMDAWNGHPVNRAVRVLGDSSRSITKAEQGATAPAPGPLFSEVVERYFTENPRSARSARQTRQEFQTFLKTIGGDKPINVITKADGRTYKDSLLTQRQVTLSTCIKWLSSLSGVFRYAEAQGFIPDGSNPLKGLAPNKKAAKRTAQERRAFTDEELMSVLSSEEFLKQKSDHPERYWVILLCLFAVCRREEAAQLSVKDVQQAEGVHFLNITDKGDGQQLKNEGSRRRIPIHGSLVQLGFLDYVDAMRKAGEVRLFPKLKKRAGSTFGDSVGKWFSRLVTKCGLTDPALVLHGFRHGGITKLHSEGCPHSIVQVLAGHAAQGVHDQVYVHREALPLKLLAEGLEKLRYDAVLKILTNG